jgi:hypothetical protein
MANYYATTRSNYFRVKDVPAFHAWCRKRDLEFWTDNEKCGPDGIFHAISADTGDCAGWPRFDHEEDAEIDFAAELAAHLDPRDAAILFEVGSEKLRYLNGDAVAVHPSGRTVSINLNDIYDRSRKAFGRDLNITDGRY